MTPAWSSSPGRRWPGSRTTSGARAGRSRGTRPTAAIQLRLPQTLDAAVAPPSTTSDPPTSRARPECPALSTFLRVGGDVFHTYSQYARGAEWTGGSTPTSTSRRSAARRTGRSRRAAPRRRPRQPAGLRLVITAAPPAARRRSRPSAVTRIAPSPARRPPPRARSRPSRSPPRAPSPGAGTRPEHAQDHVGHRRTRRPARPGRRWPASRAGRHCRRPARSTPRSRRTGRRTR